MIEEIIREKKTRIFVRKINKIKFFGIKKNIKEYKQIISDLFKKEDIEKIVDNYFGKENLKKEDTQTDLTNLLAVQLSPKDLERIIELFEDTFDKGGKRVLDTKGKSIKMGKVLNKQALQVLISQQTIYFSNILKEVSKQIGKILAKAYEEGKGIKEVKKQLVEKIPDLTEKRAERIAKSEMLSASNKGCLQGMEESGMEYFRILSARDNLVCPICQKLDGLKQRIDDQNAQIPPFHPNCRCCVLYADN